MRSRSLHPVELCAWSSHIYIHISVHGDVDNTIILYNNNAYSSNIITIIMVEFVPQIKTHAFDMLNHIIRFLDDGNTM